MHPSMPGLKSVWLVTTAKAPESAPSESKGDKGVSEEVAPAPTLSQGGRGRGTDGRRTGDGRWAILPALGK